jgi:hypothetical protein
VRRDLARVVGELHAAATRCIHAPHGDQELVDAHRRVDGNLAIEVLVDGALLDGARRIVGNEPARGSGEPAKDE